MVMMEYRSSPQLVAMFFGLLCLESVGYIMGGSLPINNVQCIESEQEALLRFKEGLVDRWDRLSSWVVEETDCCQWRGVKCNHTTGHVMALDLHSQRPNESLQGEFNYSALLYLPHLTHLDLSLNDFKQIHIPQFIGSLSNLEYLNLSYVNFKGNIPSDLGNLSQLHSLDLSCSYHSLRANNLDWLRGLSSLKILVLGGVDLSNAVNWLNEINMLPSLAELHLFDCNLKKLPSSLPHVNFSSLEILDLSSNNFNSPLIPRWLFNISHSLVHLNLKRNSFRGPILAAFGNMTSLAVLDLSWNNLEGEIPKSLGLIEEGNQLKGPSSLRELHLSDNHLNGTLVQSFGLLSKLVVLDVAYNSLAGAITEAHFSNLSSLRVLDLSSNSFVFKMSSSWIPAFRLDRIWLSSCQLGLRFPEWLRTQNDFSYIDISDAGISDTVPDWFWNLSTKVEDMRLDSNKLRGKVPYLSSLVNLSILYVWNNSFDGPLPRFSTKMTEFYLGENFFSGNISHICESMVVSSSLYFLDLSRNNFSGQLPDCWMYGKHLEVLNLDHNQFYGKIPDSIGHLPLTYLGLWDNRLHGEFPSSLKNCKSLRILDLGDNRFFGSIPEWIGESFPNLRIIYLDSNNFSGTIPGQLCQLRYLKTLFLSLNHISGTIPRCINKIMGMVRTEDYDPFTAQAQEDDYHYVSCQIDLSSNDLSGEIPREITSLTGLKYLDLSNNHLTGVIPRDIGVLKLLESLDLSRNKLSCSIPTSISELYSLEYLNVSHNNLSGKIPLVNRKVTFNETSFLENQNLCGSPLVNDCLSNETYEDDALCRTSEENEGSEDENGDGHETTSVFYISMAVGFVTAYGGFWSSLLFISSWRHAYYRFLDNLCDKIYVMVAVNVNILCRKFQSN